MIKIKGFISRMESVQLKPKQRNVEVLFQLTVGGLKALKQLSDITRKGKRITICIDDG